MSSSSTSISEVVVSVIDPAPVPPTPSAFQAGGGRDADDVASVPRIETSERLSTSSSSSRCFFSCPSLKTGVRSRKLKDDELRKLLKLPDYLALAMSAAIDSAGMRMGVDCRPLDVRPPSCPLIIFFNSKSGGRLGSALQDLLVDYVGPSQVFDLSKHRPSDVLRYGLDCLEKLGNEGDECAHYIRKRIRLMVAGGDGTVGWVLASVAELQLGSEASIPPVGIIPLGTGNDLSRSFGWGAIFGAARRSAVKQWLYRTIIASTAHLDSWQVLVKAASGNGAASLKLPHAMHPQQHLPLPAQVPMD